MAYFGRSYLSAVNYTVAMWLSYRPDYHRNKFLKCTTNSPVILYRIRLICLCNIALLSSTYDSTYACVSFFPKLLCAEYRNNAN